MEYKIAQDRDLDLLEMAINVLINSGWVPQGGVTYSPFHEVWCQAMIKEKMHE